MFEIVAVEDSPIGDTGRDRDHLEDLGQGEVFRRGVED